MVKSDQWLDKITSILNMKVYRIFTSEIWRKIPASSRMMNEDRLHQS